MGRIGLQAVIGFGGIFGFKNDDKTISDYDWWMVVGGWWSVVGGRWSVVGGRWSVEFKLIANLPRVACYSLSKKLNWMDLLEIPSSPEAFING